MKGIKRAIKRVEAMTSVFNRSLSYDELMVLISSRIDEVYGFEEILRNQTSWMASPASTRFHLAKEGGLVEHSLNVSFRSGHMQEQYGLKSRKSNPIEYYTGIFLEC